jgi:hypothetical protein
LSRGAGSSPPPSGCSRRSRTPPRLRRSSSRGPDFTDASTAPRRLGEFPDRMPSSPLRREMTNHLQGGNGAQRRRVPAGGLTEGVASGRIC